MALSNGQDQSTEFERERKRGRQGLEAGRELQQQQLKSDVGVETRSQHSLEIGQLMRKLKMYRMTFLQDQSAWPIEAKPRSEVVRTGEASALPVTRPTGLAEGFKKVCERWSVDAVGMAKLLHLEEEVGLCNSILSGLAPPMTGDLKDRMALVIGISVGMGELFDDDLDAELAWMNSTRSELGGDSPLDHMLRGDLLNVREVADLVDSARGLR